MISKTIAIVCKTLIPEVIEYYSRNFRRYKIIAFVRKRYQAKLV